MWIFAALPAIAQTPCGASFESTRSLSSTISEIDPGPWRSTEASWRAVVEATCGWADQLVVAPGCPIAVSCVRLHGEDRLATLSAASPSARAIELARTTGRQSCSPSSEDGCAEEARRTEDARLKVVVSALAVPGSPLVEAQRQWFSYRDTGCEAEAQLALTSSGWARDACAAVLSRRRVEVLSALASADPSVSLQVSAARMRAAEDALRGGHPWRSWLAQVAPAPDGPLLALLTELLEARADGAGAPSLGETSAAARCADQRSAECASAIRAETRAERDVEVGASSLPPASLRSERIWRQRWCGSLQGKEADLCEAGIDQVVTAAVLSMPRAISGR